MEMAQLEAEKQYCHDLEKQIQIVIEDGIFAEHGSILRQAAADFIADFPEHRYYYYYYFEG